MRVLAHLSEGLDDPHILLQPILLWDIKLGSEVSVQDCLRKSVAQSATVLPQPIFEEVSKKTKEYVLYISYYYSCKVYICFVICLQNKYDGERKNKNDNSSVFVPML